MSRANSVHSGSRWTLSEDEHDTDDIGYSTDDEPNSIVAPHDEKDVPEWMIGINELPYELLELVFAYAYQMAVDRFAMSQCLSLVCKFWRHIAISTPILWTTMDIEAGKSAVQEHLNRSGCLPLDVRICPHPSVGKHEGQARIAWFSNLLGSYHNQIQNVTFHAYYAAWIPASFGLLGNPNKRLELDSFDLRLLQYTPETIEDGSDAYEVCGKLNCQPRYLQVEGFTASNTKLFTRSLRSLKLSWQPRHYQTDLGRLVTRYLALSPNLEYLHLTYTTIRFQGPLPSQQGEAVIDLPQLKEIILEGVTYNTLQSFFRRTNTPRLHTLLIDAISTQHSVDGVLESATRRNPSIKKLHIKSCNIHHTSFWNVLDNLPLLTDLQFTLCDIPWARVTVNGLVYKAGTDSSVCPNLNSLTLEYDLNITHHDLIRLIGSRLENNENIPPIRSLTCRAPLSADFDPVAFVEALHDKVPELVLEVIDELDEKKPKCPTERSIEEEWISPDEKPDLDSGDEEVVRLGAAFVDARGSLAWKADFVRSDEILREWYFSDSAWQMAVAKRRLQEENRSGPSPDT